MRIFAALGGIASLECVPERTLRSARASVAEGSGAIDELVTRAKQLAGARDVYVDGGALARSALDAGLVDELTVMVIPIVLGARIPCLPVRRVDTSWSSSGLDRWAVASSSSVTRLGASPETPAWLCRGFHCLGLVWDSPPPPMTQSILTPVLALVCWTFVMWCWLYATRIPAMKAIGLDQFKEKKDLEKLSPKVRQVADNYNHLHEQPVIFYALAFYSHLVGTGDALNITLAWIYVVIRVIHSVFQSLVNIIPARFAIFALGSLALMGLALRNVVAALG